MKPAVWQSESPCACPFGWPCPGLGTQASAGVTGGQRACAPAPPRSPQSRVADAVHLCGRLPPQVSAGLSACLTLGWTGAAEACLKPQDCWAGSQGTWHPVLRALRSACCGACRAPTGVLLPRGRGQGAETRPWLEGTWAWQGSRGGEKARPRRDCGVHRTCPTESRRDRGEGPGLAFREQEGDPLSR